MNLLIVDDHAINLRLLRAQLEAEGHKVVEAANGVEALQVLEREPVEAVISDILMPVMDGFRLCLEIRKSEKFRMLPFILYTSTYNSPQDRQLARNVGADKYIIKPAPTPVLLDSLREAMEITRPPAHSPIVTSDETHVLKQYSEALVHKLEEKSAELQESERRFRDMLSNVDLVSLMLDYEARITYCNDYLLRLTGWQRDEVAGRDWFELFLPPGRNDLKDLFEALLTDAPATWHYENEILTRTGERRLIHWNNTVLRSVSGEVIGTASIGEDITERKLQDQKIENLSRVRAVSSAVNAAIVRFQDQQQLLQEVCRIAVEQGKFGLAWAGLFDPTALNVTPIAWAGIGTESLKQHKSSARADVPQGQGYIGRAIRARKLVFSNDIEPGVGGSRLQEMRRLGYRSVAVLPLFTEEVLIGIIVLFVRAADFFNDEEVKLLRELAANVSFALDHSVKQQKLAKLSRIRAVSSEINALIVRIRDRQKLLEETCRIAVEHGKFGIAWVGAYDPAARDVTPIAWAGTDAERIANARSSASSDAPFGAGVTGRAIRDGVPVIANNLTAEPDINAPRRQEVIRLGYHSAIGLPLLVDGTATASLTLYSAEPNFFNSEELELLTELASNISYALEHIRNSIALADSEKKLDSILSTLQEVVWSMDPDSGRLVYVNVAVRLLTRRAAVDFLAQPRLWRRMVHRDDRASVRSGIRELLRDDELTHEFRITLVDGEERAVELRARVRRDARGKAVHIDGTVIDITERKQAEKLSMDLSRRLAELEEDERRNINRELHDQVGPNLVALKLNFSLVRSALPADLLNTVGPRIDDAQRVLGSTIAQLRNIMADLHPPALDDYGLFAALNSYVEPYAARLGIPVSVQGGDMEPRPPLTVETALFRITQEALNNIAKHAHAQHVEIRVNAGTDRITLSIRDDGVGFDSSGVGAESSSWGLKSMRERARAIGAGLRIESTPGHGARITVEMAREAWETV